MCFHFQVKEFFRNKLRSTVKDKRQMFTEHDVDVISDISQKSALVRVATCTHNNALEFEVVIS